jgi:hypothetical protein
MVAPAVLNRIIMKMRNSARASVTGKKRAARQAINEVNLPRLFLFLEVFVDKEIPSSTK